MRTRAILLATLLFPPLASCGACEPSATSGGDGGGGDGAAPATTSPIASGTLPPSASSHRRWNDVVPPASRLPCRAMDVRGDVRRQGVGPDDAGMNDGGPLPVLSMAELPRSGWVTLEPGARLVAKDPRNSRETNFEGPARTRPCVAGEEETWMASGTFASSPGAGEAPGAEEWVVTPLGVVRYATGALRVVVAAQDVAVSVGSGIAWAWLPGGVTLTRKPLADAAPPAVGNGVVEGWERLEDVEAHLRPKARPTAATAVKQCSTLAQTAHDEAAAIMAGDAAPGLVPTQVVDRRLARAACGLAQLLLEIGPGPVDPELARAASSADSAWRGVPF